MNLSLSAVVFSLVLGILGTWLYLTSDTRNHNDYRVQETRVACDMARKETMMAGHFGKASDEVKAREKVACGEFDVQVASRTATEEQQRIRNEELRKSLEKGMNSDSAQADLQEAAVKNTAKAVSESAKAVVKAVAK